MRKLAIILFLIINLGCIQTAYCQNTNYNKFINSFIEAVPHPKQLSNNCTPIVCLIMVETDLEMKHFKLTMSDSADSLFVKNVEANFDKIEFSYLRNYVLEVYKSINTTTFYIPVMLYHREVGVTCIPQPINIEQIAKYYMFDGKVLDSISIFLPQIWSYSFTRS